MMGHSWLASTVHAELEGCLQAGSGRSALHNGTPPGSQSNGRPPASPSRLLTSTVPTSSGPTTPSPEPLPSPPQGNNLLQPSRPQKSVSLMSLSSYDGGLPISTRSEDGESRQVLANPPKLAPVCSLTWVHSCYTVHSQPHSNACTSMPLLRPLRSSLSAACWEFPASRSMPGLSLQSCCLNDGAKSVSHRGSRP